MAAYHETNMMDVFCLEKTAAVVIICQWKIVEVKKSRTNDE